MAAGLRLLDTLALGSIALAVIAAAFGGIRLFSGAAQISITSVSRLILVASASLLIRHAIRPRPTAWHTARSAIGRIRSAWTCQALRAVLPVWAASRLGVLLAGMLAVGAIGVPVDAPRRTFPNPVADLTDRGDSRWYAQVAIEGYRWIPERPDLQQNIAFFPGYPFLMHVGGALLGARTNAPLQRPERDARIRHRTLLAGLLVSLLAFLAGLRVFYAWAADMSGEAAAARAVALLSAFPFAMFYSVPYTEAIFFLGAVSSFAAAARGRAGATAAWGFLVGVSRPNGFLLTLPLLLITARRAGSTTRHWLAAGTAILGLLGYSGYIWWLTGDPFRWMEAHRAWGRTPLTWADAVTLPLSALHERGVAAWLLDSPVQSLNGAALAMALALLPIVWRRLGAAAALFVVVNLVPPLAAGGLMSIGRLTATMFPLFLALALVVSQRAMVSWLVCFAVLQGFAAAVYFTWRPLI